jgi:hypothetical protein
LPREGLFTSVVHHAAMSRSTDEALARWQDAEAAYRKLIQPLFDGDGALDGKDGAVEIQQARAKADKRLSTYLHKALKATDDD